MRLALVAIGLVVISALGVGGLETALDGAGAKTEVTNETFTPDAGNVTTLDQSNIPNATYDASVRVFDDTSDRVYEPDDFQWLESNGTIKTVSGGDLDGDTSATVSYEYRRPTETQRSIAQTLGTVQSVLPLIGIVVMALAFIKILT